MENLEGARAAMIWVKTILDQKNIPFQISGGLAAKIYGSPRPLADIDIEIPNDRLNDVVPIVSGYIRSGPEHYHSDTWDLLLMTLNYYGQDIDISGTEGRIFDKDQKAWIDLKTDLSKAEQKEIWGVTVPVTPKEELIEYKKKLARKIDLEDVDAIEHASNRL